MMYSSISSYIQSLTDSFDQIPENRKELLDKISHYIGQKLMNHTPVNLVYICTHNSRRSHFGQIWAKVAADYYGIQNIQTFSGGTEATAFNQNAIHALVRVGFKVEAINNASNPTYHVFHSDQVAPSVCFSKTYDHPNNPQGGFAAIMTCGEAEENCPFIPGVELRIGTTYHDPKAFDHTPMQDAKYDERCRQIALETLYVFSRIKR